MSYSVEIVESSSNFIELEATVGDNPPVIETIQENCSEIVVSHDVALIPSDFYTNIKTNVSDTLIGLSGIVIEPISSGTIKIYTSGLQPSGNYSLVGHSHNISDINNLELELNSKASATHSHNITDITNFDLNVSGLLPITNISAGSGISISINNKDFEVSVTGQFGLTSEQVDDRVNDLLKSGSYIYLNYDDASNSLTINATGLQPSGQYSIDGHTHIAANITDFDTQVSGLLPIKNIDAGSGIVITNNNGSCTIGVSGLINGIYAPLNSPALTGIPTVPTASSGTNTNQAASTAFVRTEISNLIGSAPSTLDTLNELATALGNDANFSTTITNSLSNKANLSGASFTGAISAPTGNFVVLQQSGINVSTVGHTHSSSEITDFDNAVSGLLPSFATEVDVYIKNTTGGSVYKGQAVYINGAQGDNPTISLAIASSESTSSKTLGILKQNLNNNEFGYVVTEGTLEGIDTNNAGSAGDTIWLSPSVSGGVVYGTNNKPYAPNHMVFIGYVLRKQQNNGKIYIKVQNGFELQELHNVAVTGATNGQFLQYNSNTQLWVPTSSGNFTNLSVNDVSVSISGHAHTTNDITNFDNSVSGLLTPYVLSSRTLTAGSGLVGGGNLSSNRSFDIGAGDGISVSADSIEVDNTVVRTTGTQTISGDKNFTGLLTVNNTNVSVSGHTHVATSISDSTAAGRSLLTATDAASQRTSLGLGTLATQNGTFSGTSSGTNTGDQTISISGDVTAAGNTGSLNATVTKINGVTLSNLSTGLLKNTTGTGQPSIAIAGTDYAAASHDHTSSNISDFNTSVNDLILVKNVVNGAYISVSSNSGIYTISATGLQPSGNYSLSGHVHSGSDITTGTVSDVRLSTNAQATINIYLWSSFK